MSIRNISSNKAEAVLTSSFNSKNTIAKIINPQVSRMLKVGVPKRLLSLDNVLGSKWSRLIAIGLRDAARIPPLAVVTNAANAASVSSTTPGVPRKTFAAVEMGASVADKTPLSKTPIVTKTTVTYNNETTPHASSIPADRRRPGCRTSSAIAVTFVRPPKLIKTAPASAKMISFPCGASGETNG